MLDCGTGAVASRQEFFCGVNNSIASVMCSFPVVAEISRFVAVISRFGTDNHTLVVTVVFGQSGSFSFDFCLTEHKPLSGS